MKRFAAMCAVLALQAAVSAHSQNADEIVRASRERIDAETVSTRARMLITAKDGSTTERLVDQYRKEFPQGRRTVVVFQKPASVAGTRFLTVQNPGRDDDRWIYLPALGKVRRIAAGEGSGSFVGTDFSYDDVSSADRDVARDTHVLLREEPVAGKSCWVIESTPRDPGYQYSRMISWIEKATSIALRIEMFDKRGALVKTLEVGGVEEVQGRLTPKTMTMTSVQAKTSTTMQIEIIRYDDRIPDSVFTTRFLETGRP